MIGDVWLGWGLTIRFEDARFEDFDRVMPGLHSRRSGCWVGYQVGA
jgi:hypothetical protein